MVADPTDRLALRIAGRFLGTAIVLATAVVGVYVYRALYVHPRYGRPFAVDRVMRPTGHCRP